MPGRHRVGIVQLGALDFLEQHRRDDRLAVLGPQREPGNQVGLGRQQVDRRARPGGSASRVGLLIGRHDNASHTSQKISSSATIPPITAEPSPHFTRKWLR